MTARAKVKKRHPQDQGEEMTAKQRVLHENPAAEALPIPFTSLFVIDSGARSWLGIGKTKLEAWTNADRWLEEKK